MNYTSIKFEIEDRVALITLNKPERRNALDDLMIKELLDAFTSANRNPMVRALLITGAGNSFCSGMDLEYLKKYSEKTHEENLEDAKNLMRMYQTLHAVKKPTIAVVNGAALGGGCGLAIACDFIFAGKDKAKIGVPEVRIGFLPAIILVYLVKRMGEGSAKETILRGDIYDSETAFKKGLITEIYDDHSLLERCFDFTNSLIQNTSASSLNLTKDLFSRFQEMDEKNVMEYAANLNALIRKTDDFKRGLNSFLDKEKIKW
ncbi:MAG: enoyl-CoA hydratase/isomerase family protein [Ignavibacteriales bacterium]|nr:enoyl-CoA hydratase/isomerase family protein [Ignavibacteriales bacterium]